MEAEPATGRNPVAYHGVLGVTLNLIISSSVTPSTQEVEQTIGGSAPVNSDSSPATMAVRYVKVWSYKS